ncbi:MAG TPA: LamG domain-containing protein [Flavisolibacter sp.]
MKKISFPLMTAFILMGAIGFVGCDKDDDVDLPPIGGYNSSDEVASANLLARFGFEGNFTDSKSGVTGTGNNVTFTQGVRGQAYQGSATGFVSYATTPTGLAGIQSFTTSMWIKTQKHTGGAQAIFMVPKTGAFWGNMFVMIEGNSGPSDSMQVKVHFEKNVTPSIPWAEQWIDFNAANRIPNMYGAWKHLAFTYDAATSKFNAYVNGQKLTLAANYTDRYNNDPASGGTALGPLAFTNVDKFIIGGFQNHLGAPWNAPETWMLNYTGALDELRIWNKALIDTDITALYQLELAGR